MRKRSALWEISSIFKDFYCMLSKIYIYTELFTQQGKVQPYCTFPRALYQISVIGIENTQEKNIIHQKHAYFAVFLMVWIRLNYAWANKMGLLLLFLKEGFETISSCNFTINIIYPQDGSVGFCYQHIHNGKRETSWLQAIIKRKGSHLPEL